MEDQELSVFVEQIPDALTFLKVPKNKKQSTQVSIITMMQFPMACHKVVIAREVLSRFDQALLKFVGLEEETEPTLHGSGSAFVTFATEAARAWQPEALQ